MSSFNRVTAVKANASKGAMLVLNCKSDSLGEPLTVEGEPIPYLAGRRPFRYLGVWLSAED